MQLALLEFIHTCVFEFCTWSIALFFKRSHSSAVWCPSHFCHYSWAYQTHICLSSDKNLWLSQTRRTWLWMFLQLSHASCSAFGSTQQLLSQLRLHRIASLIAYLHTVISTPTRALTGTPMCGHMHDRNREQCLVHVTWFKVRRTLPLVDNWYNIPCTLYVLVLREIRPLE